MKFTSNSVSLDFLSKLIHIACGTSYNEFKLVTAILGKKKKKKSFLYSVFIGYSNPGLFSH